jgi:hypothetical protein
MLLLLLLLMLVSMPFSFLSKLWLPPDRPRAVRSSSDYPQLLRPKPGGRWHVDMPLFV